VGGGVGDESVAVAVAVAVDGEDSDNGKQQKVFWHMSQILASQSRYVDTLLSSPLKKNSNKDDDSSSSLDYKEISLPDIKPSQWERMMTFLTSPSAIRSMTNTISLPVSNCVMLFCLLILEILRNEMLVDIKNHMIYKN
jgi:hypothetical protein